MAASKPVNFSTQPSQTSQRKAENNLTHQESPVAPVETRGRIEIIAGPMFAGKTTELLRRLSRMRFAQKSIILIKHSSDTRYKVDQVMTHSQHGFTADYVVSNLTCVTEAAKQADVIGIDEAQVSNQ